MITSRPVEVSPELLDLRSWLDSVRSMGELHTVDAEVDPDEEMGGLTYLVGRQVGSPALLFNNVKGAAPGVRSLFNLLGTSLPRLALALGLDPTLDARSLVAATRNRVRERVEPTIVEASSAPVSENRLTGDGIDVRGFAAPKHWPRDGGAYIGTADIVMTRDPDLGYINAGTYRMMVHDRNHLGLYLSPGKDARLHITRSWQRGQDVPVAAVLGAHPLWMIVGSQTFPKNVSELEFIGGIAGAPLEVVQGDSSGLLFPARAEIVVEGVIRANATRQEGPFGEFTGYYGRPEAACPVVEVTAVHHRDQPILTNALMADYPSCEMALFYAVTKSARLWDDLDKYGIPGIAGVWTVPAAASGFGMVVVSLEQRYAGHAAQVLALAAQAPSAAYYTKWIVAVDEDVDPTDIDQVLWAMATRCSPVDDIDILRKTWSTWLDPTLNPPEGRPWGSKALINACKDHRHLETFSRRTTLRPQTWKRIAERWSRDFGLAGNAPELLAYDTDTDPVRYHEASELTHDPVSHPTSPGDDGERPPPGAPTA